MGDAVCIWALQTPCALPSAAGEGEQWLSLGAGNHLVHGAELSRRQLRLKRRDERLHQPLAIFRHSRENAR